MSSVEIQDNVGKHFFNYYYGPIESFMGAPKISMQLPHKYLGFDNDTIRLGGYSDYLWARQERLEYKRRKMRTSW